MTSPMRTSRDVRLSAGRRGWSFASGLTTLCLMCCSGRSRARAARAVRGSAAAEGAAAAVGMRSAASPTRRGSASLAAEEACASASTGRQRRPAWIARAGRVPPGLAHLAGCVGSGVRAVRVMYACASVCVLTGRCVCARMGSAVACVEARTSRREASLAAFCVTIAAASD